MERPREEPAERLAVAVSRYEVLAIVDERGEATIADLTDRLEYTRSHTNRIVNSLCEVGVLQRRAGEDAFEYALTALGDHVVSWYETGRTLFAASSFFEAIPAEDSLPHWLVRTGDVTVASGVTPYRVIDPIVDHIDRVDRLRVAVPALTRNAGFDRASERALSGELAIEMLLTETFLDGASERFAERLRRLVAEADVTVHTVAAHFPYGFGVGYRDDGADEVSVVGYDEAYTGINGVLFNDTPRAVEWVEARFRRYLEDAVDLTPEIANGCF